MNARFPLSALVLAAACAPRIHTQPCEDSFSSPGAYTCAVPGWKDRDYDLVLPDAYDGTAIPLMMVLHGGGGSKEKEHALSCPDADIDDPNCMHQLANREGFAVVFPNGNPGTGIKRELRGWSSGGGVDNWRCTTGDLCERGIDDVPYFRDLLDDIEARAAIDATRVYSTGLSNGGAMTHVLACEMSDRLTAVVPLGGAMQWTVNHECAPERPVPLLHIHGTEDPCWQYEGGAPDCPNGEKGKEHVSVQRTMDEWAALRGCSGEPTEAPLPDTADDGMTSTRLTWEGCSAPLEHIRVDGGGHTWPSGNQYLGVAVVGGVTRDFGSQTIWDFVKDHVIRTE